MLRMYNRRKMAKNNYNSRKTFLIFVDAKELENVHHRLGGELPSLRLVTHEHG